MEIWHIMLVFAATSMLGYLLIRMYCKAALEKLESGTDKRYESVGRFISPGALLLRRICVSLLSGALLLVALVAGGVMNAWIYLPCAVAVGILGYMAPLWYFLWLIKRRNELFEQKLLDLVMGLANGMRSGLALPQALEAVSRRMAQPMREELEVVLREYRLGLELSEALERLYLRMPGEDLHLLVTSIKLTTKSGGSLVEVLEKMVDIIRERTNFQERLKNMTAQGRFEAIAMSLAPVLSFIVLYLIDPVLMTPMLTTGTGWCGIAAVLVLVTTGFMIINKIVTVEV